MAQICVQDTFECSHAAAAAYNVSHGQTGRVMNHDDVEKWSIWFDVPALSAHRSEGFCSLIQPPPLLVAAALFVHAEGQGRMAYG